MDSNLGRGASVKKTRSVFSERARAPAGGRSRCGSAERIRGILYAAPIEIESLRQRGLFFYGDTAWIRTSVEARASRKRGAFLARGRGRRQAAEAGADPRSGCAESYTPHQLKLKASGNGGFSFMATPHGFEPRSRRGRFNRCFVKFFKLLLDPSRGHVHNKPCVAALPQLDRGSDYESERHRFESYTPHQLILKASGNGGFFIWRCS